MQFNNPQILWFIIPLFFVLLVLLRLDFVKIEYELKQNTGFMRKRAITKFILFISRFILFSLLIVLLAEPFFETTKTEQGSPQMTILIDNSSSMRVFDLTFIDELTKKLKDEFPVTVRTIALDPEKSELGEDILKYLEKDTNILLISDLQVTQGMGLEDVGVYAATTNTTISAINLHSEKKDLGVWITGENRVIKNQEAIFTIHINKLNMDEYNLVVTIDDQPVFAARDKRDTISIVQRLDEGQHKIVAKLLGEDDILENNVFYKTVTVITPPKVLYVSTKTTDLPKVLQKTYDVTMSSTVPTDLDKYYAVVIEDMPAQSIANVKALTSFVSNGSGLLVVGGMTSFDRGGYKSSSFETLLPVRIGKGEKKQGDSNIVILVDMSGSTQSYWKKDAEGNLYEVKDTNPLDVMKALAIDVIDTLNQGNKVGVIAFAIPDPEHREDATFRAVKISDIEPLPNMKAKAIDKIGRIDTSGQSLFDVGLSGAYSLLKFESGSRNVILITDGGKDIYKLVKDNALNYASRMGAEGIKIYTVGTGRDVDDTYLKKLAEASGGLYFPAGQQNTLKILFGTPEEKGQGDRMSLFILNPSHFITEGLEIDATVYGFNQVVPKNLARILITTDSGENAVVEWRYGLGKVVTYTVFAGENGLGNMQQGNNTRLIYRTVNYLVGNPERKRPYTVIIPDTYTNELVDISVISDTHPITDEVELVKINEREYEAKLKPNMSGFNEKLGTSYAVNIPREEYRLGMYKNTRDVVSSAQGKVFEPTDTKEIIEYIKTVSRRTRIVRSDFIWPILVTIIITYLFEILLRKIMENRKAG